MTFAKQVSPEIWRAVAKTVGRHAPNVFFSRNFHCFGEEGQIADFGNFMFTDGTLPLPRNLKVSGEGPLFKVTWQEERMWKTVSGTDRLQIGVLYDNDSRIPRVASQVKGRRGELHGEFTLDESIGKKGARVHFLLQRNRHQVLRLPIFPRENKFMIKHEQKPGP